MPIPGYGTDKINAAYSYGTDVTIETVEQLTGQPINHYVIIDFTGFEKLVDAVGGVYLDIDRRYFNENVGTAATNYSDIDLQPGYQRLDGSDALAYVRYRHTDSTYSRDARQQTFLSELKRQTKDLGNLTNVTNFRKIFGENIEFSIRDPQKFISLLELALVTPKDRIARVSINAGSDMTAAGASIQVASQGAIDEAVDAWREPEFEFGQKEAVKPISPQSVDVVVQNGSGRLLAAEDVADRHHGSGQRPQIRTFRGLGKTTNKDEFVTAGGISRRSIDFRTMESRVTPGLYFVGESIDIDGITGGFNFQAAWTTAHIAATAVANR